MPEIVIKSDGTTKNTVVTVDGKVIKNLSELNFSAYGYPTFDKDEFDDPVYFSYSVRRKNEEKEMSIVTRYTYDPSKASFTEEDEAVDTKNPSINDYQKL
ncbi:MAG: hypothetical protein ACP6IQ_02360 [Candidatus Njordarchaeia archaeon]